MVKSFKKMNSSSSVSPLQNLTNLRINEVDRTLKSVNKNVSELVKYDPRNKDEIKLKMAKLKKERLGVLALIARSQAALAEMEVLIAENEIRNEQLYLKRKALSSDDRKVMSLKKSKMPVDEDIGVNKKPSKDKPKNQSKTAKIPTPKSRNNKKTNPLTPPNSCSGQDTKLNSKDNFTKTNSFDKENYDPFPRRGKSIIIIGNPPIRDDLKSNMVGYVTADRPMETVHLSHFKDNSIYKQAENAESLMRENTYKTFTPTSNRKQLPNNYNYSNTHNYFSKHFNNCCDKKCASNTEQNEYSSIDKPAFDKENNNIQNKSCICKDVVSENIKDTNCNKKQNIKIAPMSLSSGEMEVSDENIKTTNDVFKDIMNNKVCIQQENDDGLSFTSINTLHIDLQKCAEY